MLAAKERNGQRGANGRVALAFLCAHLLFEYLRVHDIIPVLGAVKLQTVFAAIFYLVVFSQVRKAKWPTATQSRLFLAFVGVAFATFPIATNWFYAWRFAYDLSLTLIGYFAIANIPKDERDVRTFLGWLVMVHVYLTFVGISGYASSHITNMGYTTTGTVGSVFLGDENDLALALLVVLPLTLYLCSQASTVMSRLVWGISAALILTTIVFTMSRGGFIGLAAMATWWILTSRRKAKAIAALALAAILITMVAPSEYWTRMESITKTDEGSAQERQNLWAAARRMFATSPVWGIGGDNGRVLMPVYGLEFPEERRLNFWGKAFHSLYFQVLAEFGALGVLLLGSVVVVNLRDLRRVRLLAQSGKCADSLGRLANCLRLSWVGFLVSAAFISVLSYPHLYYLTGLTVVLYRLAREHQATTAPGAESPVVTKGKARPRLFTIPRVGG